MRTGTPSILVLTTSWVKAWPENRTKRNRRLLTTGFLALRSMAIQIGPELVGTMPAFGIVCCSKCGSAPDGQSADFPIPGPLYLSLPAGFLTYKVIPTSNPAGHRCMRGLSDANGRSCRRVSAFSRHAIRIARRSVECHRYAPRSEGAVQRAGAGTASSGHISLCRCVHSRQDIEYVSRSFRRRGNGSSRPQGP